MLGPLLAADETGRQVHLAGRLRVVLVALALRANQVVSADELAELLFDGAAAGGSGSTLRSYVRRLRVGLGPVCAQRIITHPPGYLCRVEQDEVDVLEFEALCRQAGAALQERQWATAAEAARRAVALWRGTPLLDVASQALRDAFVPRLEQLHVQVLEDQAEAELRLGHHEQLVQPLRELVAQHQLRERFHAQLVLALARCGRRAEALTAYQDARKTLVAELGVEPGPELRALHERILAGDEARSDTAPSGDHTPAPPAAPAIARQLPAAAGHFTGRTAELAWLAKLAQGTGPHTAAGQTVLICAIDGMAGIGKTALAVHAAHHVSDRFPDGKLFVDLHGYTQGYPPREPGDALGMLLRALGLPARHIPEDTEERAALYRQHLSGTRTLILLDNARSESQVRPLLPGTPGCLVLITSRRRLKGLDDAHILSLDLLSAPDAVSLLRAVAGADRVPPGDPLSGEVAELCGHLPLALRIAGALLRHRPAWNLWHLTGLLREQHRRLGVLSDGERDLAGVFDLSYGSLTDPYRVLFRRLSLIPGPDLDAYAAAALLAVDAQTATGRLEHLVDHNLLLSPAPGRYRLHDLLRAHAYTVAAIDAAPDRADALDRLLYYYAHTAHAASNPLARYPRPAPDSPAPADTPALPGAEAARAWLRTERENLEAAHTHAHTHDLYGHTLALTAGLAEILRTDGPYAHAVQVHQDAAETAELHDRPTAHANALIDLAIVRALTGDLPGAAETLSQALEIHRATGDRHGEANALTELGVVQYMTGDLPAAGDVLSRALEIHRATGDQHGEANALAELGVVQYMTWDLPGAAETLSRALEIHRATGNRGGEASALSYLGRVRQVSGDLPGADGAHTSSLEIHRATGNRGGEASALVELGRVRRLSGDLPGAADALVRSLEICRQLGHRPGEAATLTELGRVRHMAGDTPAAAEALCQALDICRATSNRGDEAWALNHYAAVVASAGDLPHAFALYRQALSMNRELSSPDDEALSLEGLGECHLAGGDTATASTFLRQALEIYQRLGMAPDTYRVQNRLDSLL